MAYYPKDAAAVQTLRTRIEELGLPLFLMRKFIQLIGVITVQVEDEFTSRRVIDTVFMALLQQAEEIRPPESDKIKAMIEERRIDIGRRLDKSQQNDEIQLSSSTGLNEVIQSCRHLCRSQRHLCAPAPLREKETLNHRARVTRFRSLVASDVGT